MNKRFHAVIPVLLAFLLSAACFTPMAQAVTPLKDGDRVVFYGDSITQQRLYTRYLQQYVLARYPDLDVRFYNAGWSGDRAPGAVKRLERDVLSLDPTVVTLFFGMNDGGYKPVADQTINTYRAAMDELITRLKAEDIRVIVYAPGCVDYDHRKALGAANYNETLAALGAAAEELAEKHDCDFVDVYAAMLAFQTEQKAKDPKFTMIPDAVHPNAQGHLVMARAMLEPFAEPMPAATHAGSLPSADANKTIHLTLEDVRPFWIAPDSLQVAEASGMLAFAAPTVVIGGLPEGAYEIMVDGQPATEATAEDLAAGLPLVINTPGAKQLHDLVSLKEDHFFRAWRDIRLPLADQPKSAAAYEAMLAADEALQALIRDVAVPVDVTIALHPKPQGKNVALKKSYETSDPNTRNWGIGGLTDGSWGATSKTCFATNDTATFPKTVTVDLEQPASVSAVVLGVPPFGSTRTIAVSLSEDGETFTEVGRHAFELRKEARQTFTFPAQPARYVRLTYPDHHTENVNYNPNFMFTTELEVYATPSSN